MIKLFKYAILGLLMLDVAVLPFSCYRPSTDEGRVYVWIETEGVYDENGYEDSYVPVLSYVNELDSNEYEVGDVITAEQLAEVVDRAIDKERVASYKIVGYKLYNHDQKIKNYIEMPYTLTEEAIEGYVVGIRGAFHIVVIVEYEAVDTTQPDTTQPEV